MSFVKFFSYNLVRQNSTVITADIEDAFFPALNIKDHRTTKVFRTPNGITDGAVVFDFLTTEEVDSVCIKGSSITDGIGFTGNLVIKANPVNSGWATPSFQTTLTPNHNFEIGMTTFPTESYRFWRIEASTSGDYVEFSKVFIGKSVQLTTNNIDYGWKKETRDPSKKTKNRYNQDFIDELPTISALNGSFKLLTIEEMETLMDMFEHNKTTEPIWYIVDEDGNLSTQKERFFIYGFLNEIPDPTNSTFKLYDLSFKITEAT